MQFALANNFAARIVFWHDFYSVAGTAAATLLGLPPGSYTAVLRARNDAGGVALLDVSDVP